MSTVPILALLLVVLAFGLVSARAEKSVVTAPMLMIGAGAVLGPAGLDLVTLSLQSDALLVLSEITLTIVLFTDAARIDTRSLWREHDVPLRLLAVGMPLTIVVGTGLALLLFPELGLWPAAVLAAVLAPTDAALGQALFFMNGVPQRIRQSLNVESGLNDGLALPFFLLFASLALGAPDGADGPALGRWGGAFLLQILLSPVIGAAVGYAGGWLVELAVQRKSINVVFEDLSSPLLALTAFAAAAAFGANGFIAAFCAGLFLGTRRRDVWNHLHEAGETAGTALVLFTFLAAGIAFVPRVLDGLTWAAVLYALLSLTVVRMLPVAASLGGKGLHVRSLLLLGWFGPRGVASIIFCIMLMERAPFPGRELVFQVAALTILASILLHGVSAAPLGRLYAGGVRHLADGAPERTEVTAFRHRARLGEGRRAARNGEGVAAVER